MIYEYEGKCQPNSVGISELNLTIECVIKIHIKYLMKTSVIIMEVKFFFNNFYLKKLIN